MADRNLNISENHPSSSGSQKTSGGTETMAEENGHRLDSNRASESASEAARQAEQRAEEMVDHAAQRVAEFTALLKRKLSQVVARAREEVEDIWAEAQSIRRGEK
jgi:hypothetical protein